MGLYTVTAVILYELIRKQSFCFHYLVHKVAHVTYKHRKASISIRHDRLNGDNISVIIIF